MRLHAHRGNTFAAGVVVLAAAVVEAELRPGPSAAARGAMTLALGLVAAFGALRSPLGEDGPRPYQEVLLAITATAGTAACAHLVAAVGISAGHPVDAGWVAAVAAGGAVIGLLLARARGGTIVLGLGAAAAVAALVAGVGALWPGNDPRDGVRWVLLLAGATLTIAIVLRIDRRYLQAVALADVLAVVVVLLAATFLVDVVPGAEDRLGLPADPAGAGVVWQVLLLAAGFALAGLGATLHERGPGWLGALALVGSLGVLARDGDDVLGWPAVLGAAGALIVLVALRPVAYPTAREAERPGDPSAVVPFPARRPARDAPELGPEDDLI